MADERRRVLVVDDDHGIRELLSDTLLDEGYAVETAPNGQVALTLLREWRPHLIVLDLMMPVLDGWGFRAAQRASDDVAAIPVVVLSAMRDIQARTAGLDAAAVVAKPFNLDSLLATIDQLITRDAGVPVE